MWAIKFALVFLLIWCIWYVGWRVIFAGWDFININALLASRGRGGGGPACDRQDFGAPAEEPETIARNASGRQPSKRSRVRNP
jgi:hypothetical protein